MPPISPAGVYILARGVETLGGDYKFVTLAFYQPAKDFLGTAVVVAIGAVEEVDT
jgi:hypothetical protein